MISFLNMHFIHNTIGKQILLMQSGLNIYSQKIFLIFFMPHNLILILFWQGHCEFRWTCSRESGVLTKLFFLFFRNLFLFLFCLEMWQNSQSLIIGKTLTFTQFFWETCLEGTLMEREWQTWPTVPRPGTNSCTAFCSRDMLYVKSS